MAVTAHDIRMKEFKRSYLRGYSAEDVDTFLMYLAVEIDRRERHERALRGEAPLPVPPEPDTIQALNDELFDEADDLDEPQPVGGMLAASVPDAPAAAAATLPTDVDGSDEIAQLPPPPSIEAQHALTGDAAARDEAEAIIAEARARAERGIERAKQHAREIVAAARERQVEAERAEAEISLRLAHLERRVAERAAVLSAEARRLDELAASLAEQDLSPALEHYHTPAHAAEGAGGHVVRLARTADN